MKLASVEQKRVSTHAELARLTIERKGDGLNSIEVSVLVGEEIPADKREVGTADRQIAFDVFEQQDLGKFKYKTIHKLLQEKSTGESPEIAPVEAKKFLEDLSRFEKSSCDFFENKLLPMLEKLGLGNKPQVVEKKG